MLAEALVRGNSDLVRARQASLRAVTLAPEQPGSHLVFGMVAAAAGQRPEAETAFRRALELDPQNTAAHNELARLHLKQSSVTNPSGLAAAATGFAELARRDVIALTARSSDGTWLAGCGTVVWSGLAVGDAGYVRICGRTRTLRWPEISLLRLVAYADSGE